MGSSEITYTIDLNKNTFYKIETLPSKILYSMASATLSTAMPTIPRDTGKLRQETSAYGVKQHDKEDFSISSKNCNYAKYVVKMPDNTHWTTPGTHGQWWYRTIKRMDKIILSNAVNQNKLG